MSDHQWAKKEDGGGKRSLNELKNTSVDMETKAPSMLSGSQRPWIIWDPPIQISSATGSIVHCFFYHEPTSCTQHHPLSALYFVFWNSWHRTKTSSPSWVSSQEASSDYLNLKLLKPVPALPLKLLECHIPSPQVWGVCETTSLPIAAARSPAYQSHLGYPPHILAAVSLQPLLALPITHWSVWKITDLHFITGCITLRDINTHLCR